MMRVTNHFLVEFKAYSKDGSLLGPANGLDTCSWLGHSPKGLSSTTILVKGRSNKLPHCEVIFILTGYRISILTREAPFGVDGY